MNNQDKLLNLPIYQKAELIFDLVNSLMNAINEDDRNCRLVKGQVFLWPGAGSWKDIWDVNGKIAR